MADGPHLQTIEQLVDKLKTDVTKGLSSSQAAEILKRDGLNELEKPPKPTFFQLFIDQMKSVVIGCLLVAAGLSLIVTITNPTKNRDPLNYTTGIAILVIVMLNSGIAAYTEAAAGDALEALTAMSQASIGAVRDGKEVPIETIKVVRGDVIVIGTGDVIPADMRVIEASDMKVSEMALTGEPDDVGKNAKIADKDDKKLNPPNMVFSGCPVTNGKGKAVVVEVGMQTKIGAIAGLMTKDSGSSMTPLQANLENLGQLIAYISIGICVALFLFGTFVRPTSDPEDPDGDVWIYMILISVTLAVAAIPEGIPLCVTISLSIGSSQMVARKVLVRKLAAVETLGSASVICSDKTGTLTEGKMTMTHMYSGMEKYEIEGKGFDPTVGFVKKAGRTEKANADLGVQTTLLGAYLCSNTSLSQVKQDDGSLKWEPKGNSSEAPIVVAARKIGFTEEGLAAYPREFEVPFSSARKMMLTVTKVSGKSSLGEGGMQLDAGTEFITVCKGAPNWVLESCDEQLLADGSVRPVDESVRQELLAVVDEYSSQALRVLAVGVRQMQSMPFKADDENLNTDQKFDMCRGKLRLLGLVASIDPDRNGVPESVADARVAGIRVVMITGDYLKTAIAIAKRCGIIGKTDIIEESATDCEALRPKSNQGKYLDDDNMDLLTNKTRCFARAKPEDKLEIVKSLQRQTKVTSMTGDGVNDAPALNQADIGVAMGIQGTEVAKGAAAMILVDDNFCSIVSAVEKGRIIYAGIQKFVAFIMSVHLAEVLQIAFCVMFGVPIMRTPLQILFLILVTDLPPSIALGMEPGEPTIMQDNPRPKTEAVVLSWMWLSIGMNGAILALVIIVVYYFALTHYCTADEKLTKWVATGGKGLWSSENILKVVKAEQAAAADATLPTKMEDALMHARTTAFISLVFSENVRSYISRSFDLPVWTNLCANKIMQFAILGAQVALWIAVLMPFFSDKILQLTGYDPVWPWGYGVALGGALGCLVLCEIFKLVTKSQKAKYQADIQKKLQETEDEHMGAVRTRSRKSMQVIGGGGETEMANMKKPLVA